MTCEPCGRIGDTPPLTLPGFFSEAGSGQIFPVRGNAARFTGMRRFLSAMPQPCRERAKNRSDIIQNMSDIF